MAKRSPRSSSTKIKAQLPQSTAVSTRTIKHRLFDAGLKSCRPAKKPLLSSKNIKGRIAFCEKYRNWTEDQWENVLCSDESTFTQFYSLSRHGRRAVGEQYDTRYCTSAVKQASKLMVWGAFSGKRGHAGIWFMPSNQTMNAKVYKEVLKKELLPFVRTYEIDYFLHDGAPCHTAKSVKKWLEDSGVNVIGPWPGSSPDLNASGLT